MDSAERQIGEALGILLLRNFRRSVTDEIVRAGPDAVDAATYPIISTIARVGPTRVADLAEMVGLERSVVARRAGRLVSAGLLGNDPDPTSPRAALLRLTPAGRRAVAQMRRTLDAAIARQIRSWPPEDQQRFAVLLSRFTEADLGRADPASL